MTENAEKPKPSVEPLTPLAGAADGEQPAGQPEDTYSGLVALTGEEQPRRPAVRSQDVYGQQFKHLMIPLLVIVGAMLLVLGTLTAFRLPSPAEIEHARAIGNRSLLFQPFSKYLVLAAFPLGAILLVGAWMFRRQLKRAKK